MDRNFWKKSVGIAIVVVAMVLALSVVIYFKTESNISGHALLDLYIQQIYSQSSSVEGSLKLNIQQGELIPFDSQVIVNQNGKLSQFKLSDFVVSNANGKYYIQGESLSGSGEGFGFAGKKVITPEVHFTLEISQASEEVQENLTETIVENPVSEVSESQAITENSSVETTSPVVEETGAVVSDPTPEPASEAVAEPASEPASEAPSSDGAGITGNVIASSNEVDGVVSKGNTFSYQLNSGEVASIVSGSVSVDGQTVDDSVVKISQTGNEVVVSTDYSVEEEGFGPEYIDGINREIEIPLNRLNVSSENGSLIITLDYLGDELARAERSFSSGLVTENNSVENNSLGVTQQIQDIVISKNTNYSIALDQYFSGASGYLFSARGFSYNLDGNLLIIVPQENFSGNSPAKLTAFSGNESVEQDFMVSVKDVNYNLQTKKYRVVINRPVTWHKKVSVSAESNVSIDLPKEAESISVKTGNDIGFAEKELQEEMKEVDTDKSGILTGKVSFEISGKRQGFFSMLWKSIKKGITGHVIADISEGDASQIVGVPQDQIESVTSVDGGVVVETPEKKIVNIDVNNQALVEFQTPGPVAVEQETSFGKVVSVSAESELNYTDILAYTEIDDRAPVEDVSKIKVYWRENDSYLNFDSYDLNNDGKIDYIEWVVPHLSNQTFNIIYITKAEKLDSRKNFIEDVYDSVSKRDGQFVSMQDGQYLRVRFESNLTYGNDLTMYASGLGSVKIFNENSDEVIGTINVDGEKMYATRPNYTNADVYDLLFSGDVQVDYIVDPSIDLGASPSDNLVTSDSSFTLNIVGSCGTTDCYCNAYYNFDGSFAGPAGGDQSVASDSAFDRSYIVSLEDENPHTYQGGIVEKSVGPPNGDCAETVEAYTAVRTITRDVTTPTASYNGDMPSGTTRNNQILFNVTGMDLHFNYCVFKQGSYDYASMATDSFNGETGEYACSYVAGLSDGDYTGSNSFHVEVFDSASPTPNVNTLGNIEFTLDSTAPTTTPTANYNYGTTQYSFSSWIRSPNPEVSVGLNCDDSSGSGCANTYYCIDSDGTCDPFTSNTFSGNFGISSEGITYVRYASTDAAGNNESVGTVAVWIDNSPPTAITFNSPEYAAAYGPGNWSPSISCSDAGSGCSSCEYYYNMDQYSSTPCDGSGLPIPSFEGSNNLYFRAYDAVGNGPYDSSTSFYYTNATVDSSGPTVTINFPTPGMYVGNPPWHTSITCEDPDGCSSCEYNWDGAGWNSMSCTDSLPAPSDGNHTLQFRGIDSTMQANIGEPASVSFTYDSTPPTIAFDDLSITPADQSTQESTTIPVVLYSSDDNVGQYVLNNFDSSVAGYWRGETNSADLSGNGHDLTWSGQEKYIGGPFGVAFSTNGSSSLYGGVPNEPLGNSPRTLAFWWRRSVEDQGYAIISYGDWSNGANGPFYVSQIGGKLCLGKSGGGDSPCTTSVSADTWYHVAVTFDGSTAKIYLNGGQMGEDLRTFDTLVGDLTFGGLPNGVNDYDEILLFNRSLSADEIASLYNAQVNPYSHNFTDLGYGAHTFQGSVVDLAGNIVSTETRAVAILAAVMPISECGAISFPGVYVLNQSVTSAEGNCFNITVDNVTIDCAGNLINGTSGIGINGDNGFPRNDALWVAGKNFNVNNCVISGFNVSVSSDGAPGTPGQIGGNINIINSTLGKVSSKGGFAYETSPWYEFNGPNGGNVSLVDSNVTEVDVTGGGGNINGASWVGGTGGIINVTNSRYGKLIIGGGSGDITGAPGRVYVNGVEALSPGEISTCGLLVAPGTYTLTTPISSGSGDCLNVQGSDVTIECAGNSITGDVNASGLIEGGDAFTNLYLSNCVSAGNIYSNGGAGSFYSPAGAAGSISIQRSSVGNIQSDSPYGNNGPAGGNITLEGSSAGNIESVGGGSEWTASGNGGAITINESSVGNVVSSGGNGAGGSFGGNGGTISIINPSIYGTLSVAGGSPGGLNGHIYIDGVEYFPPLSPGEVSTCGVINQAGTYTLSADIDATSYPGNCFDVQASDVVIDLNGHTITGSSSSENGINVTGYNDVNITSSAVDGDGNPVYGNITGFSNSNPGSGNGIYLGSSSDDYISNINANSNSRGITLDSSSSNTLTNIIANSNIGEGIGFNTGSSNNNIVNASVTNGYYGIVLGEGCSGNSFNGESLYNWGTNVLCSDSSLNTNNGLNFEGSQSGCGSWIFGPSLPLGDVSACGNITQSGTYNLVTSLSSTGNCIEIRTTDVTFNGNGNTIESTEGAPIVFVSASSNSVIDNVVINPTSSICGGDVCEGIAFLATSSFDRISNSVILQSGGSNNAIKFNGDTSGLVLFNNSIAAGNTGIYLGGNSENNSFLDSSLVSSGTGLGFSGFSTNDLISNMNIQSLGTGSDAIRFSQYWTGNPFSRAVNSLSPNNLVGSDSCSVNVIGGCVDVSPALPYVAFDGNTPADQSTVGQNISVGLTTSSPVGEHYAFTNFDHSLVGYWRGEGNASDFSGNANDGSFTGYENYLTGKFGKAFSFDGGESKVTVGSGVSPTISSGLTLSLWVYLDKYGSNYQALITDLNENDLSNYYSLFIGSPGDPINNNRAYIELKNGIDYQAYVPMTDVLGLNGWHLITGTYDSASCNLSLYVDGVLNNNVAYVGSNPQANTCNLLGPSSNVLAFGNSPAGIYPLTGRMDEVMVFNRSLSPSEIASLYNATAIPYLNNFTNLAGGTYSIIGYSVDSTGSINQTETRTVTVSSILLPGEISTCGVINQAGTYTLTAPVSSNGTCFNISADDVVLDGNGQTLSYNGASQQYNYGIYISGSHNNLTIENFNDGNGNGITGGAGSAGDDTAIHIEGDLSNSLIENNVINVYADYGNSGSNGIDINGNSNYNNFTNNQIAATYGYGIHYYGFSTGDTLTSNNITSMNNYGIMYWGSSFSYNNLTDNIINAIEAIYYNGQSTNNSFINNNLTSTNGNGITFANSPSISDRFIGNIIVATQNGISYSSSSSDTLTNNSITSTTSDGISYTYGGTSMNDKITENNITSGTGILLYVVNGANISGNTINAGNSGIWVNSYSLGNIYSNNVINSVSFSGIDFYMNPSTDDVFSGNNITSASSNAIHFDSSSNARLTGNTLISPSSDAISYSTLATSNTIEGNNITSGNSGIAYLTSSAASYNVITGNNITSGNYSIVYGLGSSTYNNINGNTITSTSSDGIFYSVDSINDSITSNTISSYGDGIYFSQAWTGSPFLEAVPNSLTPNQFGGSDHCEISVAGVCYTLDFVAPMMTVNFPPVWDGFINSWTPNVTCNDGSGTGCASCSYYYETIGAENPYGPVTPMNCNGSDIAVPAQDGRYYLYVLGTDFGGNSGSGVALFTYDTVSPVVDYSASQLGSGDRAHNNVSVNLSVVESNLGNVTYRLYSSANSLLNTSISNGTSFVFQNLSAGVYKYNATVYDLAGNNANTTTRNLTILRSCMEQCSENANCSIATNCTLYDSLCSGYVCDFQNLNISAWIWTLYDSNGNGNNLSINLSGVNRFINGNRIVFSGRNGTQGGNAGTINFTVPNLFNTTGAKLLGIGGKSTAAGLVGGNGGQVILNYRGLVGGTDMFRANFAKVAGTSGSGAAAGLVGGISYNKNLTCIKNVVERDADINGDGLVNGADVAISDAPGNYNAVNGTANYSESYDINCDNRMNVIELSREGWEQGRGSV